MSNPFSFFLSASLILHIAVGFIYSKNSSLTNKLKLANHQKTQIIKLSLKEYIPKTSTVKKIPIQQKKTIKKVEKKITKKIATIKKKITPSKLSKKSLTEQKTEKLIESKIVKVPVESNSKQIYKNEVKSKEAQVNYETYLLDLLEKYKKYPKSALRRNIQGVVTVSLTLNSNGDIKSLNIVESSGSSILDKEAKELVNKRAPYRKFPEFYSSKEMYFRIPIVFNLNSG